MLLRLASLLVAVWLLAGCGGGGDEGAGTTAAAKRAKVGLVSDVGRFNDKSFNQSALEGLSAVGGIKLPTVDIFIAGHRAGAQACNKNVQVLIGYSQDFVAQDKRKEIALDQIARGSQVVFQVAGGCGLGALDAAKERGTWGVGVDRDQSDLGPHILTSAVKRVDASVFDTAQAVRDGTFEGGTDAAFNLKNDGVALGKISDKVPQTIRDRIDDLRQQIVDGKIAPPSTL